MHHPPPAPPPAVAPPPPMPGVAPRRPWWRRGQLPFILSLVLVLPIAVGVPWWLDRQESLAAGSMPPPAPESPTGAADLAGVRWEFRGTAVGQLDGTREPPEGVEVVDAVFGVTPLSEAGANLLAQNCQIAAQDDAGREWNASTLYEFRDSMADAVQTGWTGCEDDDGAPLAVDETHPVVATYEVPADAVDTLSFVVTMDTVYYEESAEDINLDDLTFEWDPDEQWEPSRPVSVRLREPVL